MELMIDAHLKGQEHDALVWLADNGRLTAYPNGIPWLSVVARRGLRWRP